MDKNAAGPPEPTWIGHWLALLLDQPNDYAVILTDADGRITGWLRGAEFVFGYSREETVGQPLAMIFLPEDQQTGIPHHELATAAAVGAAQDDRWHVRKDGSRFWGSGMTLAVRDRQGRLLGFGKIVRDRTDLRTQVESLKNRLQAEAAQRERQEFALATLAHELRNPLSPLRMAAELLRRSTAGQEALQPPIKIIERQALTLQRLLDDMMDMARSSAGKMRLEIERVCLQQELRDAMATVDTGAEAEGITLQAVLPEFDVMIDLDRDRFQQIIVNLLNNAIKHTPRGGSIWVNASIDTGHAVVRVDDNGEGIPAELQPQIFDLFTQGPDAGSTRGSGMGIGLALVKEFVEMHGGTVAVRSEGLGKGSRFALRLPLTQKPQATPPDAA